MSHTEVATQLAAEVTDQTKTVQNSGRQGDVLFQKIGPADPETLPNAQITPSGGVVVDAGLHGEHRLISKALVRVPQADADGFAVYDVHEPSPMVHTDTPESRHDTCILTPGRWKIGKQQELGLDGVVREVRD